MSIVLVSRNSAKHSLNSVEMLRFHGEHTTLDPEGIVRIGDAIPDVFFPSGARTWVVSESFKALIEQEIEGLLFDPVFMNRLIYDPGDMELAVAQSKHESNQPPHGVLDYFIDQDQLHRDAPALYWMRLPLFGTGDFMPEVTEQIVKCRMEHLFLNERAYQKYVSAFLTDDIMDRLPIFTIHSSLAMTDWLFNLLEPVIDSRYYQVSSLHET